MKHKKPKEYDYKAHGEEEPEAIDPDYQHIEGTPELTVREYMAQMATDAFQRGWLKPAQKRKREEEHEED